MNKRIRELAEQAGAEYSDCHSVSLLDDEIEKFAELIVRECAAYLNGAMEVHNQREQDLCDLAARKVKEHFGFE